MTLSGDAHVGLVVDVRRFPGSRRHPHVAQEQVQHWLPAGGIAYRWEPRLGGRRRVPPDVEGTDAWWQVEAFRAYAAHTRTEELGAAIRDLIADVLAGPEGRVAVMCSQSLWWRCHRILIADVVAPPLWDTGATPGSRRQADRARPGRGSPSLRRGVALRLGRPARVNRPPARSSAFAVGRTPVHVLVVSEPTHASEGDQPQCRRDMSLSPRPPDTP
ncbi:MULTISPECIES: DUF488 domain-containing protein [Nocardioides]|uniref:DUF488 domain-containing protein n=1 Tax=Nocardioides TaxID=1839 RepID=UPI001910F694